MKIADALAPYSNPALQTIALQQGLFEISDRGVRGLGRISAIQKMSKKMAEPDQIARNVRQIGAVGRAALRLALDGITSVERLRQALTRASVVVRPPGEADQDLGLNAEYIGTPTLESALARCAMCGVIFAQDPPSDPNATLEASGGTKLVVPDEVAHAVRDYALLDEPDAPNAEPPPHGLAITPADFLRDVGKYWRYIRTQGGLRLTQQGWIYKTDFRELRAVFNLQGASEEAKTARLWFLRRQLLFLHMLDVTPNSLVPTEGEPEFNALSMAERLAATFGLWTAGQSWNEMAALQLAGADWSLVEFNAHDQPHGRVNNARLSVLRQLAFASQNEQGAPSAAWLGVEKFIEKMRADDYNFLYPRRQNAADGYFSGNVYTNYRDPLELNISLPSGEAEGWDEVERKFITHILTGPLHWMGLLEFDRLPSGVMNAPPDKMRLTPAGLWLLNLAGQPTFVESGGRVLVQPNFSVLAMEPVSDAVLADIENFADYQSGDRAMNYAITRQSVYRGQRAGWSAERIIAFLESHQGGAIPANIRRSLEEWQQLHSRITFYRGATLVQYADPDTRQDAQTALGGVAISPLNDTFDLADDMGNAEAVLEKLRSAGWSPLVSRSAADPSDFLMKLSEDGAVKLKQAVPDALKLGQVLPLAEQGEGGLRISAKSVRAAMAAGQHVDGILVVLGQLAEGGVPGRLQADIRAWAAFYGAAIMQEMVLLELPATEVLEHALKDSELGKYLIPIERNGKPLALVPMHQAQTVRALLEERGVEVRKIKGEG